MALIDSNNFITHLVWSGLIDKATCGQLKEAIELCTVDAKPIVHAKWVDKQHFIGSGSAICSACGKSTSATVRDNGFSLQYLYSDYCPNCGATMDKKE